MSKVTMYVCEIPWHYDINEDTHKCPGGIKLYKRLEDVPCRGEKPCQGVIEVEVRKVGFHE